MAKILFVLLVLYAGWWLLIRKAPKTMPEAEARAILGLSATADADEVRAAHRRLIAVAHPDRGGSAELARRINAARDVLLKRAR